MFNKFCIDLYAVSCIAVLDTKILRVAVIYPRTIEKLLFSSKRMPGLGMVLIYYDSFSETINLR